MSPERARQIALAVRITTRLPTGQCLKWVQGKWRWIDAEAGYVVRYNVNLEELAGLLGVDHAV